MKFYYFFYFNTKLMQKSNDLDNLLLFVTFFIFNSFAA